MTVFFGDLPHGAGRGSESSCSSDGAWHAPAKRCRIPGNRPAVLPGARTAQRATGVSVLRGSDDGGLRPPAVARLCTQDSSDCAIQIAPSCCGADGALGIAKSQAEAYSGCFALPPGACSGLGCAKYLGYTTDTGQTTPWEGTAAQPIDLVSVSCVGRLCTTDVVLADAGQDASSADAAQDVGGQACGSTTCHSGQACVLVIGGPAPQCQAAGTGAVPQGWCKRPPVTIHLRESSGARVAPIQRPPQVAWTSPTGAAIYALASAAVAEAAPAR